MTSKNKGLGRGLSAFFPQKKEIQEASDEHILYIPLPKILFRSEQPRKEFPVDSLLELAESIKNYGILQPIIVKKQGENYLLLAGERRLRAAKIAQLEEIPAIIKDYTKEEICAVALIENLQREDLNVVEEAFAYQALSEEFSLSPLAIGEKIGKSRSYVANIMRLLKLPLEIQEALKEKKISQGTVRPLLSLVKSEEQLAIFKKILEENLSARQVEELVRNKNAVLKKTKNSVQTTKKREKNLFFNDLEERLAHLFSTKVNIKTGKKKNHLEIEFYNEEDLERILEILTHKNEAHKISIENFSV